MFGRDTNVVDLLPKIIADAYKLNINIYKQNGLLTEIDQYTSRSSTDRTVSVLYTGDHYDAIVHVWKGKCSASFMMNFSDDEDPWVSSSIASTDVTMDACSNAHSDDSLPDSEGLQVTSGMCLFREDRLPMSEKEDFCFNYLQGCKQSGSSFPTRAFAEEECEWVTKLPGDINGFTVYKIKTTEIEWKCVTKDCWYFTMASSKWKFFNGKRKVGKCEGSFSCGFGKCPFFEDNQTANKVHFINRGGKKFCFSCERPAIRTKCEARKLVEFDTATKVATIFHIGWHSCNPKQTAAQFDDYITECIEKFPSLTAKSLKMKIVGQLMEEEKFDEAEKAAEMLGNKRRVKQLRSKALSAEFPEGQTSFDAVGILKESTDKRDKFIIYKINNKNFNGQPDYVFKSHKDMAKVALSMDQNLEEEHFMQEEPVYFDGSHS